MGFLTDWLSKKVGTAQLDTVVAKLGATLYFKELALHIAKSYIANALSKCEYKVIENGKEVHDELYYRLNVEPNPNQNSSQFINKMINKLYDDGHVLIIKHKNYIYVADGFSIDERPLKENLFTCVTVENHTFSKPFKASEVFYLKLDYKPVKDLMDGLYETYGQLFQCAVASYKRSNGRKYKLILETIQAGDQNFAKQFNEVIKGQLKNFIENDNVVYPQFKGTELQEIGNGGTQTVDDVLKIRKEMFDVTAQALKIPLPMMYGNITNMKEIVKVFLTFAIDPLADMIEEEFTRKTNTFDTWSKKKRLVLVDTTLIEHIDIFEIAEKIDKVLATGLFNIDELRVMLDRLPLNTEFSKKHFITKNYTDVEKAQQGGEQYE